jgi:alkylhydroperoxidase family enzyme
VARVRLNEVEDAPAEYREFIERVAAGPLGFLNIYRALSHTPNGLRQFMRLGNFLLTKSSLEPKLRELAILRAGWECRSPYEFSQHVSMGRAAGLSDAQIRAVGAPHQGVFAPQEMAVLAYAGEMSRDSRVSDATHTAVAAFLNDAGIVELAMTVGFYNLVSRVLNALEVDLDPGAARGLAQIGVEL